LRDTGTQTAEVKKTNSFTESVAGKVLQCFSVCGDAVAAADDDDDAMLMWGR